MKTNMSNLIVALAAALMIAPLANAYTTGHPINDDKEKIVVFGEDIENQVISANNLFGVPVEKAQAFGLNGHISNPGFTMYYSPGSDYESYKKKMHFLPSKLPNHWVWFVTADDINVPISSRIAFENYMREQEIVTESVEPKVLGATEKGNGKQVVQYRLRFIK